MNEVDDAVYILDALQKIANFSIYLYQCNDAVMSEVTRVLNIYSKNIEKTDDDKQKEIYSKSNKVLKKAQKIDKEIIGLKNYIQSLLEYISNN